MASARSRKDPRPNDRRVSFWPSNIDADHTLLAEVAKWLCHPKVSFSTIGFVAVAILRIHHVSSSFTWCRCA